MQMPRSVLQGVEVSVRWGQEGQLVSVTWAACLVQPLALLQDGLGWRAGTPLLVLLPGESETPSNFKTSTWPNPQPRPVSGPPLTSHDSLSSSPSLAQV